MNLSLRKEAQMRRRAASPDETESVDSATKFNGEPFRPEEWCIELISQFKTPVIVERQFVESFRELRWLVIVDAAEANPETVPLTMETQDVWAEASPVFWDDQVEEKQEALAHAKHILELAREFTPLNDSAGNRYETKKPMRFFITSEIIELPIVQSFGC